MQSDKCQKMEGGGIKQAKEVKRGPVSKGISMSQAQEAEEKAGGRGVLESDGCNQKRAA